MTRRSPSGALLVETLRPYRRKLAMAGALAIVATGSTVAVPYLVKDGIDDGVIPGDGTALGTAVGLVVAAAVVGAACQWGLERLAGRVAESSIYDLRQRLWRHVQAMPFDVFDRQRSGRLVAGPTNDIEAVHELLSSAALVVVPTFLLLATITVVLFVLDVVLALVVLTTMPLLVVATRVFKARSSLAYRAVREQSARIVGRVSETLTGIRAVQAFSREVLNQGAFEEANLSHRAAKIRAARLSSGYGPFTVGLANVSLFLVLVVGGFRAIGGQTTVGVITAFILYVRQFFGPLQDLSQFHNSLQAAGAGLERIAGLLAERSGPPEDGHPVPLRQGGGEVRLEGVNFAYADEPVLHDIDLRVRAGETLAVVGATGAGKSTIAKLVARSYEPVSGRILLDGQDLADLPSASLGRAVVTLPQEPFLFHGSVADNIALGRPGASRNEVVAAAEAAGAHPFIASLPEGYDTEVRQAGARLSAGQRQLVSLARAWLVSPRLLVLDEATSALDLPTERAALAALGALLDGRTAVVISHRLSVVDIADRVAVVEDGRIVEVGNPADLLRGSGLFKAYHDRWSQLPAVAASS